MARRKSTESGERHPWSAPPSYAQIPICTKQGLYKTLAFQSMRPFREWREYATTNLDEAKFIRSIGVEEFVALD